MFNFAFRLPTPSFVRRTNMGLFNANLGGVYMGNPIKSQNT